MDFCSRAFSTKISSSCPSTDGFEVENLLSENTSSKGFQAERFTHTPVYILIKLPLPIQLKQVDLTPYIGQQCAKVVQISVLRYSRKSSEMMSFDDVSGRVGSATMCSPCRLCFRNEKFEDQAMQKHGATLREMVVNMAADLRNVIAIKISIMSMLVGSVASIGKLQVWGKPSRICSKGEINGCIGAWLQYQDSAKTKDGALNKQETPAKNCTSSSELPNLEKASEANLKPSHQPPTDFIDPLMCTVMKNPVLLPSGHSIDQNTLDKHVVAQSEWGRPPSDPFTGIMFNENYKPVPDVNLKVKLDKYLFDQPDGTPKVMSSAPPLVTDTLPSCTKSDFSRASCSSCSVQHHLNSAPPFIEATTTAKAPNPRKRPMESSLDDALRKAKTRQAQFRTVTPPDPSGNQLHCGKCNVYLSSLVTHYRLPCQHQLCRSCLVSMETSANVKCPSCCVAFRRDKVCRSYL